MIEKIDYKTYLINKKSIVFPCRVWDIRLFEKNKSIITNIWPEKTDIEYNLEYKYPPFKNIRCYDMEGNLKWIFPLGITGIGKADEDTVTPFDGEYLHYVDVATGIEDKNKMRFLK